MKTFFSFNLKLFLVIGGALLLSHTGLSQNANVQNLKYSQDGDNIVITYDLGVSGSSVRYNVTIFSSHNNFAAPLKLVVGDVGQNVKSGENNKIIWQAKDELPKEFDGEISLKITADAIITPIVINPLAKTLYKKGEPIEINWLGGNDDTRKKLTLLKNNTISQEITTLEGNVKSYRWTLPKKGGANYSIAINDVGTPGPSAKSQEFTIQKKTPLMVKILIVAGVGAGVYLLIPKSPSSNDLPTPGISTPSSH